MNLTNLSLLLAVLSFVPSILFLFLFWQLKKQYSRLTEGVTKKDLLSSLNQLIDRTRAQAKEIEEVKRQINEINEDGKNHLQKIGFKRFNPFTDTGGNQSFIMSFLDANNTGVVISSLHSRENTRVYAKKVTKGVSTEQILSKDELEVVKAKKL